MRILYLHQYFNTLNMSGGTRSFEMAKRFAKAGHDVHIITSWREPTKKNDWFVTREEGFHVHWSPVLYDNSMSFFDRIKAFFKFAFRSAIKVASIEADVIFASSTPLTIAFPAVYGSKKQKIPLVFEVRDLWPEIPIAMGILKNPFLKFIAKKLEIFAYKNSSSIVVLSPGMKKGVLKTGFPSSRIAVIPNSADIKLFKVSDQKGQNYRNKQDWLGQSPLLIYAGTFGLINGVDFLVDLARELKILGSDIKILAIGGGQKYNEVLNYAKSQGILNKNFFIKNYFKKKDLPSILNAATMSSSLFIDKPEMRPNSANKFFDSLAAGKPIMINYGGWMNELIKSEGCGLSLWKKPIRQAASELDQFMHNTHLIKSSSDASSKLAKKYFDRDKLAYQLLSVIENTVNGYPEKAERISPGIYNVKI